MAVLETIRVKFGILITVLIAVALLSFIIDPTTLQSVSSSMSSKYDVGNIDGKAVSYNDFQAELDKFTTINEISTGSSAKNNEEQQAIRNAAWQSLIDQYLFVKNAKKAGLDGVVCSPLEAEKVHNACGNDFVTVTPGVRFADGDVGDQKRVMTPAQAKEIGSDYIVVGRPITAAEDPVAAYERCVREFIG